MSHDLAKCPPPQTEVSRISALNPSIRTNEFNVTNVNELFCGKLNFCSGVNCCTDAAGRGSVVWHREARRSLHSIWGSSVEFVTTWASSLIFTYLFATVWITTSRFSVLLYREWCIIYLFIFFTCALLSPVTDTVFA